MTAAADLVPFLEDDDVYELSCQNELLMVTRGLTGRELPNVAVPAHRLRLLLGYAAQCAGVPFDEDLHRSLNCDLPKEEPFRSARLQALLPPIARGGPQLSIRKRPRHAKPFEDYVADGTLTASGAAYIFDVVVSRRSSLLVVGSTDSGKTTLLNSIFVEVGRRDPMWRCALLEDRSPELVLPTSISVGQVATSFLARGDLQVETSLEDLVSFALRMGPDSVVVGEVRETAHVAALMNALRTGHAGGGTSFHAGGAAEALQRLEAFGRAGPYSYNVPQTLVSIFECVVFIERCSDEDHSVFQARVYRPTWDGSYQLTEVR